MRFRSLALAAVLALGIVPSLASAQPASPPPDWSVTLAGRVWSTSGWSNWNFKSAGVDPLTDIRWRGVDAVVGELAADVTWKRVVWMLSFGGNTLDDGVMLDDEYAQSNRQARFSFTRSPVEEGYVVYVNNDLGFRVAQWTQSLGGTPAPPAAAGYLDVFVGYQFWREEYTAFGVQGSLFLPGGLVINQVEPLQTKVLTHQYTRHSIRLGARAQIPLIGGLSSKLLVAISPWTHTEHEAQQFLRTDIKPPTISKANGGFGYQLEAGLAYNIVGGLSAEAGFRYWKFDSGSGDVETTSITGAVVRNTVNEMITERYGPYLAASWRF
jgi:opacity protein-like surface antigen